MKIEKISPRKVSEMVEIQIENWIESGHVQPGDKLPSARELCEMFNVGRSAVRDALTSLKGRGMLDVRQGEGAFVCQVDYSRIFGAISRRDIRNLYMVRKILEVGIAETAAQLREPQHIGRLQTILQELTSSNMEEAWKADYQFHLTIAEATQNEVLVQLMKTLSSTMEKAIMDCQRIILDSQDVSREVYLQHLAIYEAIALGSPQQAKDAMFHHLTYVEELLSKNT